MLALAVISLNAVAARLKTRFVDSAESSGADYSDNGDDRSSVVVRVQHVALYSVASDHPVDGIKQAVAEGVAVLLRNHEPPPVPPPRGAVNDAAAAAAALDAAVPPLPVPLLTQSLPLLLKHAALCPRLLRQPAGAVSAVVGLDAEWRPERARGERSPVALLQLAFGAPAAAAAAGRCGCCDCGARSGGTGEAVAAAGHASTVVLLYHLAGGGNSGGLPPAVRALLADPSVLKVGAGVAGDAARLGRDFGAGVRGAVEVRDLFAGGGAGDCSSGSGNGTGGAPPASLAALARAVLGAELDKSLQLSDWGAPDLSGAQVAYAAADALAARELAVAAYRQRQWQRRRQGEGGVDGKSSSSGSGDGGDGGSGSEGEDCEGGDGDVALVRFLAPFARCFEAAAAAAAVGGSEGEAGGSTRPPKAQQLPPAHRAAEKGGRKPPATGPAAAAAAAAAAARLQVRRAPLYSNCRIEAPDGAVLATCSRDKVAWYADRGLGDVVSNDPPTVRLRFEPRGRDNLDDAYYLSDKRNECAACGAADAGVVRKSVVPHCYRRHFPEAMRSHLSHDVLPLCPGCHLRASAADAERMRALGVRYGAPVEADARRFEVDRSEAAARSAARALLAPKRGGGSGGGGGGGREGLPPERRARLEALMVEHFGAPAYDEALARRALELAPRREAGGWVSHAELVVRRAVAAAVEGQQQDGSGGSSGGDGADAGTPSPAEVAAIEAFVKDWRRHFVATIRPRFLPPFWSVDARVANSTLARPPRRQHNSSSGGDGGESGEAAQAQSVKQDK